MYDRWTKHPSDILIMWILLTNPFSMVSLYFMPDPIGKVWVELAIWMETIASFD